MLSVVAVDSCTILYEVTDYLVRIDFKTLAQRTVWFSRYL